MKKYTLVAFNPEDGEWVDLVYHITDYDFAKGKSEEINILLEKTGSPYRTRLDKEED